MLLDLAAQKWNVNRDALVIADGKVSGGGRSAGFGELARGEKWTRTIPASVPLAEATEWKTAGKSMPKVNGLAMVTGAHKYTYDMKRAGHAARQDALSAAIRRDAGLAWMLRRRKPCRE